MATKRRRGAAKRTYAKQEAARKRGAPGKRFVGETAEQSANARQRKRKTVARMARAARKAQPAEAARTATAKRRSRRRTDAPRAPPEAAPPPESGRSEAAFRAAEESAAMAGAEVEPLERPLATVSRLEPREAVAGATDQAEGRAPAVGPGRDPWLEPSVDVSSEHGMDSASDAVPPLGSALGDLARSAFALAKTVVGAPLRIAFAVPRFAIRAMMRA